MITFTKKISHPIILFLLFVCHARFSLVGNAARCHPDDESGLLGFKSGITADPSGLLADWNPGTHCCSWSSIDCRVRTPQGLVNTSRVVELSIYGGYSVPTPLSGTISPSLSKLRHLTGLYLVNLHNLTGSFPSFIFNLPNLKYFYVENAKLSGHLPPTLGRLNQLQSLNLAGNLFSGEIPASITVLTRLSELDLGRNLLSGTIPPAIRQLKHLRLFSLEGNRLKGPIPDISPLTSVRYLRLSGNLLHGDIPQTMSTVGRSLEELELAANKLTGKIPHFIGTFVNLRKLNLSRNSLTGSVPETFKQLTEISSLDLSDNQLTNPFPEMNATKIAWLHLSRNRFHFGGIPAIATNSPMFYSLKVARCGIEMDLGQWKPRNPYFYDAIDLSENWIRGSAVELLNQTQLLNEFSASGNRLRFDLGKLRVGKDLEVLNLSRNMIFGNVTASVVGVKKLDVSYNHLCGRIPANSLLAAAFVGNDCLCGSPLPSCRNG